MVTSIDEFIRVDSGHGYGDGHGSGYGDGCGSGYGSGCGSGCGDGCGSGYGSGCGSGCGSGYGSGCGSGCGCGDGDGCGSGCGCGDGYGSGCGSGCGDGYGCGSGCGSGDGIKIFNGMTVHMIDDVPTIITSIRGNIAKGFILNSDFTLSKCFVVKQGNMFAHGDTLHSAMEALRDKLFEDMPEEERIDAFLTEFEQDKHYPAKLFFDWHNRLTGSCEMGRNAFCSENSIDVNHDTMTVADFINYTRNAYGGDVIRQLEVKLKNI